jgi:hypothetical protein
MIKIDNKLLIPFAVYTSVFGGITHFGILLVMFLGFGIGRDTTGKEMIRCYMGVFVYLVIMFAIYIVGGIFLHRFLKKNIESAPS